MEAALAELSGERVAVRFNLTPADMDALLSRWGEDPRPRDSGIWPLASFRGMPVYYGERSEIVYSDGTVEPLR